MKVNELFPIDEGRHDRFIFKAVFMAGSPGAGKSSVAQALFGGSGMKIADVDQVDKMFKQTGKALDYERVDTLNVSRRKTYMDNRLGLIIDGTARDASRMAHLKTELDFLGYDTCMVFVNTDLETARARVKKRFAETGREVTDDFVVKSWEQVQNNLMAMRSTFGQQFFMLDNSESPMNTVILQKKIRKWLNSPPTKIEAKKWLGLDTE
jgi:predicted ABC-type ATPase